MKYVPLLISDEFIVYDPKQVLPQYLIHFRMTQNSGNISKTHQEMPTTSVRQVPISKGATFLHKHCNCTAMNGAVDYWFCQKHGPQNWYDNP